MACVASLAEDVASTTPLLFKEEGRNKVRRANMVEPLRFPDNDLFKGWGEPLRCETTIEGLEVIQGAIPEGLQARFYRVGADRQYPPGAPTTSSSTARA